MGLIIFVENRTLASEFTETLDLAKQGEFPEEVNIGICWRDVAGESLDGVIGIYASNYLNDDTDWCLLKEYTISTATNEWDKEQYVIPYSYRNIALQYTPNAITAGILNVDINIRDK